MDSRGSPGPAAEAAAPYTFEGPGRGPVWSFTPQSDRLEKGYLKWLLHLGQRREDRFKISYDVPQFHQDPNLRPAPGEIWDIGDECCGPDHRPATHDKMIWTPQYSATGFFADDWWDGWHRQYYHIYLHSPQDRSARLCYRAAMWLTVWNNGRLLCHTNEIRAPELAVEQQVDFTLHQGLNFLTLVVKGGGAAELPWWGNYLAVRITDGDGNEFSDLTYSLEPPPPDADVRVARTLPGDYDPSAPIPVELHGRDLGSTLDT
ncbi:MAG: hypothetical protein FJ280_29425 [Planctomycetes bacterium]|nr:hypothetical protein [Planctomycetota bacterium]